MSPGNSRPFFALTISIAVLLVFPWVLQDGMFCDGILYASVSKNLAGGHGSFWSLPGSCEGFIFHEQPPLVFYMQSFFFKIFNNSLYSERIYCVVMYTLSILFIHLNWRKYFSGSSMAGLSFVPVFLYIICPVSIWSYANNVIEISMVNFVLLAMYFIIKWHKQGNPLVNLSVAGAFILGASLCKGVQGTFLITAPFITWLIFRRHSFSKMLSYALLIMLPLILFYSIALTFPEVRKSYEIYFQGRFGATFAGKHNTVPFHLYLLWDLFQILIPELIIVLLVLVAGKKYVTSVSRKDALFFLLVSACGILPLMATKEQRTFYMLTALPFLMIGLSIFIMDPVENWVSKVSRKFASSIYSIAVVLLISSFAYGIAIAGTPKRDVDLLHDVYEAGPKIGNNAMIGCSPAIFDDWAVSNYFNRYYHICIVTGGMADESEWYIVRKDENLPQKFVQVNSSVHYFKLGRLSKN